MMKRVLTVLTLMILATSGFSQKSVVSGAWIAYQNGTYDVALKKINEGIKDPEAAAMAKSWFYKAEIIHCLLFGSNRKVQAFA